MNRTFRNTLITIISLGVLGLLVWQLYFSSSAKEVEQDASFSFVTSTSTDTTVSATPAGNTKRYENKKYSIAFLYPKDFIVSFFSETETVDMILIQGGEKKGIQIAMTTFDEKSTVLTKERILKDIPSIKISNEQSVTIDGKTAGISFDGIDSSFGKTAEVWFVHNGYLFQVTTYIENKDLLRTIVGTLKFV